MNEEKVIEFINFINELVDDEFSEYLDVPARYYFLHGGCLELAKVLRYYIPESTMAINENGDHIAIKYRNNLYDGTGKIEAPERFFELNDDDVLYLSDYLGRNEIKFERKSVDNAIIQELEQCSGNYVKNLISNIRQVS